MRKILLSSFALLMSVAMMAIGAGNGTNKANAIDFDWANGHIQEAGTALWYRVSLSQLEKDAYDPTLALYLTNLAAENSAVTLSVSAELLGQQFSKAYNYQIAGKDYQLWSVRSFSVNGSEVSLKNLMQYGLGEVYVQLKADKQIALTAKVYETEDIVDDACSKAVDFDWDGVTVPAGEKWFRLNLAEVKNSDNQLKFVVANDGAADAHVAFDMSLDCPASAVIEKDWVIAAGAEQEDEFGRIFLDVLKEDYVFLRLTNDQPITLSVVEEILVVEPGKYDDFTCDAPVLEFNEELNLTAGKHVYKVKREDLIGGRSLATEFYVTNQTATPANLTVETAFACPVKSTIDQTLVIDANATVVKAIKDNVLKAVNSEWVYLRFITDQDLTASVGKRDIDPCATAVKFDWTVGAKLEAGASKWYEMDIASLKQNKQHLNLAFYNHSDSRALVSVELALECNGTILPIVLPIPANLSISQVIDYQLLKRSPLDRIYLGVSTDSDIELAASVKNAIADDQTPCLNALNPEHGVEYVHEANTTSWYKISLDLLKSTDAYSSFYVANKGNQRANVTIGIVTDCMYTTGAKLTVPLPAGFELGALAPNIIGNLIEELTRFESAYNKVDAKEVYLELHSDQPIHFGLDVTNATTNPCLREDLVTFDWTTGAKIEAGKATWFDMELDAVKELGSHINFTFTNHADSIVWVATVVSVDCPAKLTLPLLVPVPAHASVDQLVDYSILDAVNIDNIYVGIKADGPVELKATPVNATVIPSEGCTHATEIAPVGEYTQKPGTQWYKFPMSLVDEMGAAAKISFSNLGSQTANLTAGVTVGCEYSIAHHAKLKLPRVSDMSINLPKRIMNFARKFVDTDVEHFYLQLTTDQAIKFGINMHSVDVDACREALDFDWAAWEQEGLKLQANQDIWYKLNLDYLFNKLEKGEDLVVNLINDNEMDVEVQAAVSPICPALLTVEKTVTVPAEANLYKTFTFEEVMKYVGQYDKYIYDGELEIIFAKLTSYQLYNKLVNILEQNKYTKFIPFGQIELIINTYGDNLTIDMVKNYEKYLSVEQLKDNLQTQLDYVSFNDVVTLLEKYGDYIPFVDAESILKDYEKYLPYAGGVAVLLQKFDKYITVENLKQLIDHFKQYLPVEELKQLIELVKQYIPEYNSCYVNIKTTGDLEVNPPVEEEPCCPEECDDVPVLDWAEVTLGDLNLNQLYKLDITGLYAANSAISFYVNNNVHNDTVVIASEIYAHCQADAPVAQHSNKVKAEWTMVEVPYEAFAKLVTPEQCCMFVKFTAIDTIPDTPVEPNKETITKDITEFVCDGTEYVDIKGDKHIISSLIPSTQTWTVTIEDETTITVYNYVVTPIVAPEVMTAELLATIGATPVLVAGEKVNVAGTVEAIKNHYAAQDTEAIADVESVVWTAGADATLACDAEAHTMILTVTSGCEFEWSVELTFDVTPVEVKTSTETATICEGQTYPWGDGEVSVTGSYPLEVKNEAGCVVEIKTLVLTVTPADTVELTETACDSYEWHGEVYTETGDYTYEKDCYKETLHLTINKTVYEEVTVTECYAYDWNGVTYTESGNYTYTTVAANGCDSIVTLHLTITAETPEENPALGEAEAVAKYGNRMIVLHLNGFAEKYGWTPAAGQVAWYQVVGEMDNSWEIVDDKPLGAGLYIENLDGFSGQIYAIIDASNEGACGNLYRTKDLVLAAAGQAPKLMPTIARPSEDLHLLNLNPANVAEVRVFNTNGELLATYSAEKASEFVFKAATMPGYYMVEVQHNGEQTTLRYIVK